MKILVINTGSSSIKFQLIESEEKFKKLAKGSIDGLNLPHCLFKFETNSYNFQEKRKIKNHEEGINFCIKNLLQSGIVKDIEEITAIGHRVVHGGEKYTNPTKINSEVITELKRLIPLAPLHNPPNIQGILACRKLLKSTPQVAIFDTAFHRTMPEKAYLYAIPAFCHKEYKIRRYGFHGTNHRFVVNEALKILKTKKAKIISCHLGNGSSITASINGKSIDTSMGLTPLEGPLMGTRSGSIDPSIIFYLHKNAKLKVDKINEILNEKSGLLAISETSYHMLDIYKKSLKKDPKSLLAIEMFAYQIAKYCGGYAAAMQGLDALIFTGGIGENAFYIRKKICKYLEFLGIKINTLKNKINEEKIHESTSKIKVLIIPANEEKQIAIETYELLNQK